LKSEADITEIAEKAPLARSEWNRRSIVLEEIPQNFI
jgi:hypothetical protein